MPGEDEHSAGEVSDGMSENEHEYDEFDETNMSGVTASHDLSHDRAEKKKYDPKDPLRPRRKKARRACFACQRAHLTCGDERPCQRCIKRGLADGCQDGVRKKAKYLHDAPPEALRPVLGPPFTDSQPLLRPETIRNTSSAGSDGSSMAMSGLFSSSIPTGSFPMMGSRLPMTESIPFAGQLSPVSPSFQSNSGPRFADMAVPQAPGDTGNLAPSLFDPGNAALYSNLNFEGFGSQYGALEFEMLNHMSSGAVDTPSRDPSISATSGIYGNMINPYDGALMNDIFPLDNSGNPLYAQGSLQHGLPHAYAIAAAPTGLQSPSTDDSSPQPSGGPTYDGSPASNQPVMTEEAPLQQRTPRTKPKSAFAKVNPQSLLGKRQRDPSSIYDTVTEPFSYVAGFHRLIAKLKRRFPGNKISRIAKALASFRPSFISCTRTLNRADLVFMEKCFQRTLFEYEDIMHHGSSPTLVCRRTGEIAAVSKEFVALTGWSREVLLGEEPNLNVNIGGGNRSDSDASSLTTPKMKPMAETSPSRSTDRPQPLFLPELMDDDSVVQFYEDFAHLAFGDARGSVMRKCNLLKYRVAPSVESPLAVSSNGGMDSYGKQTSAIEDSPPLSKKGPKTSILSARVARIDGEHGIGRIGKDGKLSCVYSWTIRRDTFEMPMMIVMNFLPCYYPNQEPHQFAV